MEVKTKSSKIANFIRELAKESRPADIATFVFWIVGFYLWIHCGSIAKNTNFSLEIRVMYLLFVLVYLTLLAILTYQTGMIHTLKRIEQKIEQR